MAWTTPRTWVANETVPAATMNLHVRDNLDWLKDALTQLNVTSDSARAQITPALFGARAYHSTTQTFTTSVAAAFSLDSERFDSNTFHDTVTNNSRLTVPASSGGYYVCGGGIQWVANTTGQRVVVIRLNGTTNLVVERRNATTGSTAFATLTTLYQFAAADYIEMVGTQNSGGNLNSKNSGNSSPEFWMHRLSSA